MQLLNIVIILSLLAIHFVIKERTFLSSLFFYGFPLPVIIVLVVALSILLTKKRRKYNLIIASVLLLVWLGKSFKIHLSDSINENDLEIVFWNASRDNTFESVFNENRNVPDVMVLVESQGNDIKKFKRKYPNYFFYKSDREIFITSKTPIEVIKEITSNHKTTIINFKTDNINFYAVDVMGSPDVPRSWELSFVNKNIKNEDSTIVLGDFNTPYESMYLKRFKSDFNHAFNKKGNGFRETWLNNIPLLSLDHIWVSKDLKILKTEKTFTTKSDHNMLKTYIKH